MEHKASSGERNNGLHQGDGYNQASNDASNDASKEQQAGWKPPDCLELLITAVEREPKQKYRYRVYIQGELAFTVHEDVMIKYRLVKGMTVDRAELMPIMEADERQKAYVQAIRFLGSKPRTVYEIEHRLQSKGFQADTVAQIISRLRQERLVDDQSYAKQWADQRVRNHKKGRLMIKHELQQKGVHTSQITEALEELDSAAELDSAYAVGFRKWSSSKGDRYQRKQKTTAFLMRRGFPSSVVRQALERIMKDAQEDADEAEVSDEDEYYFD